MANNPISSEQFAYHGQTASYMNICEIMICILSECLRAILAASSGDATAVSRSENSRAVYCSKKSPG